MNHSQTVESRSIKRIKLSQIEIPKYQHDIDYKHAKKIADSFDANRVGLPTLEKRDGRYYINDGLHRITAMKMRGVTEWDFVVIEESYEDAAKRFYTQKDNDKPPSIIDKYFAKLEAKDKAAMEIDDILKRNGFIVNSQGHNPKHIKAIAAVERIYAKYSGEILEEVLIFIDRTWSGDNRAKRWDSMAGLAHFISMCKKQDKWNAQTAYEKLSIIPISKILSEAHQRSIGSGATYVYVSEVITTYYNKGRRVGSPTYIEFQK